MKTLIIDIETTPNLAHVWGIWQQNVGLNQLLEVSELLCFAAKWMGESKVMFYSQPKDGQDGMVRAAWELLNEADTVMHFNGRRFDIKHLNREFLLLGLTPPAPYRQIDLLDAVKRTFSFPSNKLAYVSKALGLAGKEETGGHDLWIQCMAGNRAAWQRMRKYNERDVVVLEEMYEILQPWIPNHPSHAALNGEDVCPACGGTELKPEGYAYLTTGTYQRWRCEDCGKWSRSSRRVSNTNIREIAA